jgi:hypothetical protein
VRPEKRMSTCSGEPLIARAQAWIASHGRVPSEILEATLVGQAPAALAELSPVLDALCTRRQPVRIGAAGSGVTYGHGFPNQSLAWPAHLARALRWIWQRDDITVRNSASPATTAPYAALCYKTLFPDPLDLLIIEYSMTTRRSSTMSPLIEVARGHNAPMLSLDLPQFIGPKIWPMCRLQRKYSIPKAGTMKSGIPCQLRSMMLPLDANDAVVRLFEERGVPVVSTRAVHGWFKGTLVAAGPKPTPLDLRKWVSDDGRHISRPAHIQLASFIVHALVQTLQRTVLVPPPSSSQQLWKKATMPDVSVCAAGKRLLPYVLRGRTQGWAYVVENDKPGMVASTPGSLLSLLVNGTQQEGRRASLYLSYLTSYQHMGRFSVRCRLGCECNGRELDGHDMGGKVSLQITATPMQLTFTSSAASCLIEVQVLPNSTNREHKVKLTSLTLTSPHMDELMSERMRHKLVRKAREGWGR